MTKLQTLIRKTVALNGSMDIQVGTGSPANMGTIKCLLKDGYRCVCIGATDSGCKVYTVTKA